MENKPEELAEFAAGILFGRNNDARVRFYRMGLCCANRRKSQALWARIAIHLVEQIAESRIFASFAL